MGVCGGGGGGGGGAEDCFHLFFQSSLAQKAWRAAAVVRLSVTSEEAFWNFLSRGHLQWGGGLEADFRHAVGHLDPQERGHHQGCDPIRRCHYSHCQGVLSFLASRWRMPLDLCTPATRDLVVMFFINSMEIGDTVWDASLPLIKKI